MNLILCKVNAVLANVQNNRLMDISKSAECRILIESGELCEATLAYNTRLTYLIGHNNPINRFRSAATHPSRRLYFLRAFASWLHLSMTGFPRFSFSNGYKFADFRRSPHQIPVSSEHPPPYERHIIQKRDLKIKKIPLSIW